jgi:hypothetical protein
MGRYDQAARHLLLSATTEISCFGLSVEDTEAAEYIPRLRNCLCFGFGPPQEPSEKIFEPGACGSHFEFWGRRASGCAAAASGRLCADAK